MRMLPELVVALLRVSSGLLRLIIVHVVSEIKLDSCELS